VIRLRVLLIQAGARAQGHAAKRDGGAGDADAEPRALRG